MKPFLKFAGGKRQLLPELRKYVPKEFGRYYEPFVGGGALFWDLAPKRAVLGDTNEHLITTYRAVRDNVEELIAHLLAYKHTEEEYYDVRALPMIPSAFIYLNKTCFNGLYRVNKSGKFNVPFGKYVNPLICDADTLWECSMMLKDVRLIHDDFEETVIPVRPGDFVYFDPPYLPVVPSFKYTPDGFNMNDQVRLRDRALELKQRGVHVLLSNSGSPLVWKLYGKGFTIHEVMAKRAINSRGSARGAVKEVIIT